MGKLFDATNKDNTELKSEIYLVFTQWIAQFYFIQETFSR